MCDYAERTEQLVGYLYGELGAGEREAFEAHLAACGACRAEVAGLETTRARMAEWVPPEAAPSGAPDISDTGLRLVRGSDITPAPPPARRLMPAWALAAAATLVLAAGAAIANLEVRLGSDGLVVRTGWAQAAPAGGADGSDALRQAVSGQGGPVESVALEQWTSELARVQTRLNELEDGLASRSTAGVPVTGPFVSEAEMLRLVRQLVSQSETRQQRELTARVSQVVEAFDRQRRLDLALIQQGMGQYHGLTNAEIARQSDVINQLVRVATRQER